jgi:hypothetical protein
VCVDLSLDFESRDAEDAVYSDATMKGLVDLGDIERCECRVVKDRVMSW